MSAHNGPVPTADLEFAAVKAEYYRGVRHTLLEHLRGREVLGFGDRPAAGSAEHLETHQVPLHINDVDDLDEAVRSGVIGFSLRALTGPGIAGFRVRAGVGTGIDTVATVTLALAQSLGRDGLTAVALTDGSDGLYLFGFEVGMLPAAPCSERGRLRTRTRRVRAGNCDDRPGGHRWSGTRRAVAGRVARPGAVLPGARRRPDRCRGAVDPRRNSCGQRRYAAAHRARRRGGPARRVRRPGRRTDPGDRAVRVR